LKCLTRLTWVNIGEITHGIKWQLTKILNLRNSTWVISYALIGFQLHGTRFWILYVRSSSAKAMAHALISAIAYISNVMLTNAK